ncbi:putative heat shock protein 70 [Histomonas meleagridis]|uniref:putative heat shock protein 70 n=1 Tax=Histomonas meleagridis TaxID=135588 RepID=UPI00355A82F7|nr:putative heat shock protein 70 [Histomonas meleagridis]KAH0798994.1 putative heat shock protein 70 [Histomonas meleagridis]
MFFPFFFIFSQGQVLGIDIGTKYCCITAFQNGKVDIIAYKQLSTIISPTTQFVETGQKFTSLAKNDTSFDNFYARHHSYVEIQQHFSPEEIIIILRILKKIAEKHLGHEVRDTVITIPAYFNDFQRKSIINLGTLSGLNIIRLLYKPVSIAIAYDLNNLKYDMSKILIFDFGSTTLSVALLENDFRYLDLLSFSDLQIGGDDINNCIFEYISNKYQKKTGKNLTMTSKLSSDIERAKCELSFSNETIIKIDEENFIETITREQFEELNKDIFQKLLDPIKDILNDAKIEKNEIDKVVLAGGSSLIPQAQEIVQEYFHGKEILKNINPKEVTSIGAATFGDILVKIENEL